MKKLMHLPFVLALLSSNAFADGTIIHGRVDHVIDGDTVVVVTENDKFRLRIRGIDAPELGQDFGKEAREGLSKLVNGRTVIIKIMEGTDRFGRRQGSVAVNDTDVGLFMLENGFAWYYEAYGLQIPLQWQRAYTQAEINARESLWGLWDRQGVVPPWTWRKQKNERNQEILEEKRNSLGGIQEELNSDLEKLGQGMTTLKDELFDEAQESEEQKKKDQQLSSEPDWWNLVAKIGENISRWIKAFIFSIFE